MLNKKVKPNNIKGFTKDAKLIPWAFFHLFSSNLLRTIKDDQIYLKYLAMFSLQDF